MTDKNKNDKGSIYFLLPNIFKYVIIIPMKLGYGSIIAVLGFVTAVLIIGWKLVPMIQLPHFVGK